MAMVAIDNALGLPSPGRDSSPSMVTGLARPRGSRVRKARDLFAKVRIKHSLPSLNKALYECQKKIVVGLHREIDLLFRI